jgi:exosortase
MPTETTTPQRGLFSPLVLLAFALPVLGWSFWPTLEFMYEKWVSDPQYSHGFLVPLFSGYLLWRAHSAGQITMSEPWPMLGLIVLACCIGMRGFSGAILFHQLDAIALLISLAALALAFGGTKFLRCIAPALGFLIFMIPLPYEIERNVGGPLKMIATQSSTFLLQTMGLPAIAEGNLILIDEVRLGVVDACSGLKMLITFTAFGVGAILLLTRTRFEKLMVLLGIVPIAVLTNVLRITATGVAHTVTHEKATVNFLHDLHGWLMMPLGLALLALQLAALAKLVVRPR